jgi:hypothetical protein
MASDSLSSDAASPVARGYAEPSTMLGDNMRTATMKGQAGLLFHMADEDISAMHPPTPVLVRAVLLCIFSEASNHGYPQMCAGHGRKNAHTEPHIPCIKGT